VFTGTEAAVCLSTTETTAASVSPTTDKDETTDPTQQISSARVPPDMVTDMEEEQCNTQGENTPPSSPTHLEEERKISYYIACLF